MTDATRAEPIDFGNGLRGLAMGAGPAVLWIHGYTLDSHLWPDLWVHLPGLRHIGVDLPGHGASRPIADGETVVTIAAELCALARRLEARRLVGLSFGSIFALQMALDGEGWFEQVAIAAPTISGGEVDPDAQRLNREIHRRFLQDAPAAEITDLWLSSPPDIFTGVHALNPPMAGQIREIVNRHGWHELRLPGWRGMVEHEQSLAALAGVDADTMILVGENDMPIFRRNAYKLARAIPGARRVVIDEAGHLPLVELPDVCARILAAHFRTR